jgi:tRNA1Val (adenine37-N6)-methyltransferase
LIKEDFVQEPNLRLLQDYDRYTMTSDTLHLAKFMNLRKSDFVLDVGTNNGVLALIAQTYTQKSVIGIDIDTSAIQLAKENAIINDLSCHFLVSRVQDYESINAFDVIVCNPPYFVSNSIHDNVMDFDNELNLEDLAKASFRLLKDKGRLYIILKTHRLMDAINTFAKYKFSCKRLQMIHHSISHPASSVCIELSKNGKSHLVVESPILNQKELFK